MKELFKIDNDIPKKTKTIITLSGLVFFFLIWVIITHQFENVSIQLNASKGLQPYSFTINGPDEFEKTVTGNKFLSNLKTGEYNLTLKDSNQHQIKIPVSISSEINDTTIYARLDTSSYKVENKDNILNLSLIITTSESFIDKGILPSPFDVLHSYGELLAEKVSIKLSKSFIITSETITKLRNDSVPEYIVGNIQALKDNEYKNEDDLSEALIKVISEKQLDDFGNAIAGYSEVASYMRLSSLLFNMFYSILLNILGYIEAIALSLIFGFLIALVPFFRSLLSKYIDAIRFIPLAAVTGLFIAWFGIELNMKIQFLAFGIFVFLIPVVVQRIDEVAKVYKQTAYTLGASNWQIIKNVYWPHVTSKIIDDVRVLTAISWTYIIVAELVNKENGLGALIFTARRHSRLDQVFALLILIIIIGIVQDFIFKLIDKKLYPYKYS